MPVNRACEVSATYDASDSSTPSGAPASDQRTVRPCTASSRLRADAGQRLAPLRPVEQGAGPEAGGALGVLELVLRCVPDRCHVEVRPGQPAGEVLEEQRRRDRTRA